MLKIDRVVQRKRGKEIAVWITVTLWFLNSLVDGPVRKSGWLLERKNGRKWKEDARKPRDGAFL